MENTNAPRALCCDDRSLECEHEQRRMRTESHTYLTVIVYCCCVFIEAFYGCALSMRGCRWERHEIGTFGILHACGMYGSLSRQCKTFQYNRFDWFRASDFADFCPLPSGFAESPVAGGGGKSAVLTARKLLLLLSFRAKCEIDMQSCTELDSIFSTTSLRPAGSTHEVRTTKKSWTKWVR